MPCRSDYMDPTKEESNRRETSEFIVFVYGQLGIETPKRIVEAAKDAYGLGVQLDVVVEMLCESLSGLSEKDQERIIYNAKDKTSRRLADWWEEHQEADKKRIEKELQKAKDDAERQVALAKLTPHERKLLGY